MKKCFTIFKEGDHEWLAIARDPEKPNYLIDTNEYVISGKNEALLTDPGGMEIFAEVFSAISKSLDPKKIRYLFASHQDPDIISSLGLWLEYNPDLKCYLSWLWGEFVPHFGGDATTFIPLPDQGKEINVGDIALQAIPAHHLHSAGNFHLYDQKAKILFSGDIGAALVPTEEDDDLFVNDFDKHIGYARGFHQRWMGSEAAKRKWCERVSKLNIDMLCPQHGSIYRGKDVERFINWFSELPVGLVDDE